MGIIVLTLCECLRVAAPDPCTQESRTAAPSAQESCATRAGSSNLPHLQSGLALSPPNVHRTVGGPKKLCILREGGEGGGVEIWICPLHNK